MLSPSQRSADSVPKQSRLLEMYISADSMHQHIINEISKNEALDHSCFKLINKMYKAACSVFALRPFGDVSVANQVNMEVTVVYETVCVVLHYETVSSLTSFPTSFPLRAGFPFRAGFSTRAASANCAPKPLCTQNCKLEQGQLRAAANPCCRAKRTTSLVSEYDIEACVFAADCACLNLSGRADQIPDHGDDAKHTAGHLQRDQAVQDTFSQRQIVSALQRLPECGQSRTLHWSQSTIFGGQRTRVARGATSLVRAKMPVSPTCSFAQLREVLMS